MQPRYNTPSMQHRLAYHALTPHRLARLVSWAKAWLCWLASVVFALIKEDPERAGRFTRFGARFVADLILHTALQTYRTVRYPRRYGVRRDRCAPRLVRGSRLRKATAKRDPLERLVATLEMLRDFDAEVARLSRRLATGLRRWHTQAYAWRNEAIPFFAPRAISPADTS